MVFGTKGEQNTTDRISSFYKLYPPTLSPEPISVNAVVDSTYIIDAVATNR